MFIRFHIVVSVPRKKNLVKPTMKTDFSINGISRSFMVKHILGTPRNNICFNCKDSEDMATEITKNGRF